MKYITKIFLLFVFLVAFLFIGYKVFIDKNNNNILNIKIAIIDSDRIVNDSLALKNIQQQIKEQSLDLKQKFENEIEKSKPSKEEFEFLSEEAKREKTEQFDKYALNVRDLYAKKILDLEKNYRDALDIIFNKIKEIAKKNAEEKKIDLIFFLSKKNQVLYSINNLDLNKIDLSDSVLVEINKEISEFNLNGSK